MTRRKQVKRAIRVVDGSRVSRRSDYLASEEPLEIQLRAGREHKTVAITMRTPGDDYELAAGFLYSEGIVASKRDVIQMDYCVDGEAETQEYNALAVHLRTCKMPELPGLDRHFLTNSACGVCGRIMLDDLAQRTLPELSSGPLLAPSTVTALPVALRNAQRLFASTGGLHAAALFTVSGELLALREDVGRHNALDKLVGWGVLSQQLPFSNGIIMVSGRASYELLHKCRVAGAPIFCAVSAPSSLAVELAERFDMTLIGFLRDDHFNIYAGHERIQQTHL